MKNKQEQGLREMLAQKALDSTGKDILKAVACGALCIGSAFTPVAGTALVALTAIGALVGLGGTGYYIGKVSQQRSLLKTLNNASNGSQNPKDARSR